MKNQKEQIEQMKNDICSIINDIMYHILDEDDSKYLAENLYDEGYRKQSEGEWIRKLRYSRNYDDFFSYTCSECNTHRDAPTNYCPNCGSKMKGGE